MSPSSPWHRLPPVLVLLLVMLAGAAGAAPACPGAHGALSFPYALTPPPGWEHDRFAIQGGETVTIRDGAFTAAFTDPGRADPASPYQGLPRWVAYEMRALRDADGHPLAPAGARRPRRWYELEQTAALWRDRPGIERAGLDWAYRGVATRWNRGHLAARAHADRLGWAAGCNSHVFVNAVPEQARLNQGEWQALENYAAAAANRFGRVWTIAGPLFEPGRPVETIGGAGVVPLAVPHALFKILAIETAAGLEARAFLFPQDAAYHRCGATPQEAYDFARFAVPLAELERTTGLRFFPLLSPAARAALEAASAAPPWPVAAEAYPTRCGPRPPPEVAEQSSTIINPE